MREAAAGHNTGGIVLHDPQTGTFIGISPADYHPTGSRPRPPSPSSAPPQPLLGTEPFVHLEDLGEPLPVPMYRTPTGLGGHWEAQLPEFRNL